MLQLYDLAGIYFRAFYAVPASMTGPSGTPTGAIRGSLDILARVIGDGGPRRGVACLDVDWRPAWRVALVPSYKAHRVAVTQPAETIPAAGGAAGSAGHVSGAPSDAGHGNGASSDATSRGSEPRGPGHGNVGPSGATSGGSEPRGPGASNSSPGGPHIAAAPGDPLGASLGSAVGAAPGALAESVPDDLAPQVPVLLEVLRAVGIPLAGAHGCEADDVIGTLAARETAEPVEVVSGDRDLFQVVRTHPTPVTVRYIGAGMSKVALMDVAALRERYGVDGPGYAAMATLRGDPSDGLPGVAGIGEKTATDLASRFGTVADLMLSAADPHSDMTPAVRRRITTAADYLAAAVAVVAVRTDAAVQIEPATVAELPDEPVDPARLDALVREHGIGNSVDRLLAALRRR